MSKYKTEAARCAKEIRELLKTKFPMIRFSVKSQTYSMGDNVNVDYTDGPTELEVEKLVKHFQYGHFDGMQDLDEITNNRDDIPQTKYLFVNREYSQESRDKGWEMITKKGFGHTCRGLEEVANIGPYDKFSAIRYELKDIAL